MDKKNVLKELIKEDGFIKKNIYFGDVNKIKRIDRHFIINQMANTRIEKNLNIKIKK